MEKQKEKLEALIQFLNYQMTFWGLCTIIIPLAAGFRSRLYSVNWFVLSFVPFFLYLIRRKLSKAYQFLLSHLATALLLLILPQPSLAMRVFYAVGVGVILLLSFKRKLSGEKPATEPIGQLAAVIFGTVSLIMLNYMGFGNQGIYIGICLVLVFSEYVLHQFLVRYQNFIFFSKDSADHIAGKAIFKNGLLHTIAMMALTAGSMLCIFYMRLWQKLFLWIRQLLVQLIRFLFSLLPDAKPRTEEYMHKVSPDMSAGSLPVVEGDTWIGWEIIWTTISLIVIALALFLFIRGIYALVKLFIAAFGAGRATEEQIQTDEILEIHEQLQVPQEEKTEKMSLWDKYLSPEGKVRRMYRLYVSRLDTAHIDRKCLAPMEACSLREQTYPVGISKENLEEFCDIYEYTRYSGGKTSQQQVTRMRKCLEK